MPGVFITATGTGVGKTIVSAGIAYYLRSKGVDVGIMKPFATRNGRYSQKYASEDTAILAAAAAATEKDSQLNPYFYPIAASPFVAAEMMNRPPASIAIAIKAARKLLRRHQFVIIEGIGGLMTPLSQKKSIADFAEKLDLPVLIVTLPFLGTLNHTMLTLMACTQYELRLAGVLVNRMPKNPDRVTKAAPVAIQRIANVRSVKVLKELSSSDAKSAGRALGLIGIEDLLSMK